MRENIMLALQLHISPRQIVLALSAVAALLLCASMAGQTMRFVFDRDSVFGLVQLFNVDMERNIPTFFTVMIALGNALLLLVVGLNSRSTAPHETWYWYVLAAGFVFIGYDEGFQVHEKLIAPMRSIMGSEGPGIFHFGWVVPAIALVCVLGLIFLKFLLKLAALMQRRLLTAAVLYLGGCLGMEMLDGAYAAAFGMNYTYSLLVTIEEGLEMAGMIMLTHTLLCHLASQAVEISFSADTRVGLQPARALKTSAG